MPDLKRYKMSTRLVLIFVLPLLTQCANYTGQPQRVILKHPVSYEFQNCESDEWKREASQKAIDECVEKYESLGYEVWGRR